MKTIATIVTEVLTDGSKVYNVLISEGRAHVSLAVVDRAAAVRLVGALEAEVCHVSIG